MEVRDQALPSTGSGVRLEGSWKPSQAAVGRMSNSFSEGPRLHGTPPYLKPSPEDQPGPPCPVRLLGAQGLLLSLQCPPWWRSPVKSISARPGPSKDAAAARPPGHLLKRDLILALSSSPDFRGQASLVRLFLPRLCGSDGTGRMAVLQGRAQREGPRMVLVYQHVSASPLT